MVALSTLLDKDPANEEAASQTFIHQTRIKTTLTNPESVVCGRLRSQCLGLSFKLGLAWSLTFASTDDGPVIGVLASFCELL